MSIDFKQLHEFLCAIAKTPITELKIKEGDFELTVLQNPGFSTPNLPPIPETTSPSSSSPPPPVALETLPAPNPDQKWMPITSPMVGTFYLASAPGESSFVEVNERIRVGQIVCIIEAMKLMNEIESDLAGQIMEIAVENGQPVEYGQTLMWINPE